MEIAVNKILLGDVADSSKGKQPAFKAKKEDVAFLVGIEDVLLPPSSKTSGSHSLTNVIRTWSTMLSPQIISKTSFH